MDTNIRRWLLILVTSIALSSNRSMSCSLKRVEWYCELLPALAKPQLINGRKSFFCSRAKVPTKNRSRDLYGMDSNANKAWLFLKGSTSREHSLTDRYGINQTWKLLPKPSQQQMFKVAAVRFKLHREEWRIIFSQARWSFSCTRCYQSTKTHAVLNSTLFYCILYAGRR